MYLDSSLQKQFLDVNQTIKWYYVKEHIDLYWKGVFHGGTENGIHKKI